MNEIHRTQMAELLRGGLPSTREIDELINEDVVRVEAMVDDLVEQAEIRGKLEVWLSFGEYLQRQHVQAWRFLIEQELKKGVEFRPPRTAPESQNERNVHVEREKATPAG